VAGIVIAVAGATAFRGPIFTAGLAWLVAGVSMSLGEYVSVSSQRDSERAEITEEKRELTASPQAELTTLYEAKGVIRMAGGRPFPCTPVVTSALARCGTS